jgi:ABC-2 type transport system permease protein
MFHDVMTVVRKEWQELLFSRATGRNARVTLVIFVGITGVMFPLNAGTPWFNSWGALISACFPIIVTLNLTADSFAGERERHTLETLLASRLPDHAIVIGKIVAIVAYAWAIVLLSLPVSVLTLNLAFTSDRVMLPRADIFASIIFISLLAATFAVTAGVFFSMRAATVRQAAQRMLIPFVSVVLLPTLVEMAARKFGYKSVLMTAEPLQIVIAAGVALLVLDVALLALALRSFRRPRLMAV